MSISRREFLTLGAGVLGAGAVGVAGTGLYEPHQTVVTNIDIALKRLPPAFHGLRVAQLSDIHFNSYMTRDHLEKVVDLTNAQRPDLVMFTGDFVTAKLEGVESIPRAEQAWPCADLLRKIVSPLGSFAVLGNHDYDTNADVVTEALSSGAKIQVMRNRAKPIEKDGARLWLAGIDNVSASEAKPDVALQGVPRQECVIAAVHEPDFADEMLKYPVDFQMSGHSHGGQVRLPFVGALYLPWLAKKYPEGYYRLGKLQLYTNRGIGVIGLPVRFMCPPEITIFTLRAG